MEWAGKSRAPRTTYPAGPPQLVGEDPGVVAIFAYHNLILIVWNQPASLATVDCIARASRQVLRAQPAVKVSVLQWVAFKQPMPPQDVRVGLAGLVDEFFPHIACLDTVLAHSGFWASAFRAAILGMRLLIRNRIELRVDGSLEEALPRLVQEHFERTGVRLTVDEVMSAMQQAIAMRPAPGS